MGRYSKPFLVGVLGMAGLIAVYILIVFAATRDMGHVIEQFLEFRYWISALVLGFGIQMGLFWYIRSGMHLAGSASTTAMATGASTSTVAMVACCVHHLTDFLPILGLSAVALFLSEYQTYFFLFGVVSNIAGIMLMIYIIKTKTCPDFRKLFKKKI